MKDETYVFIQDVKEKKTTARSARHTRTHCGKGGRVRLPSDNLSKKELMKMNGECKSYRLNQPMTKEEFQSLPDDLKATYIKLLRSKYGIPDSRIGKAMGYPQQTFQKVVKKLGLGQGKTSGKKAWDKEGFYAWWNGVDKLPTPVIEEVPISQEEKEVIFFGEEKGYVEDDLPFEEPEAHVEEDIPCIQLEPIRAEKVLTGIRPSQAELEAQLRKAEEEICVLKEKCQYWQMRCDELDRDRHFLQAQMDVVRLIFGGRNNG